MSSTNSSTPLWASGDAYEPYVGRWSRLVAQKFIDWLDIPEDSSWLDVGCGTGALSQTVLKNGKPKRIKGVDRSQAFVEYARHQLDDPRVEFEVGDAQALPVEAETFDVAISGLVLNFVSRPDQMVAEMGRAVYTGGVVALYVWDYAGKMQMMRHFWNAAAALDPAAYDLDEGRRSPICNPVALADLFHQAGFSSPEVCPIDIETTFRDFDDYWVPFLRGHAPAPAYAMSLSEERRAQLRQRIQDSLPFALDGSIPLVARAWGIKATK